ncbi:MULTISPECIES: hypothetical protein [Limimaricola]|uniref:DUF1877 family protein n=1 Tax=Limimaricola cinnabarinus TaxID=1125964 RepID=A0A2G1MC44_9RHOB|nr:MULTISPECIES: hypothetical protein [Limimaricola]MCZ4262782.1 hypothetical protein [Limimaricola sp. G21655-S1]PHP26278.1 hypothetical protein CJ301_17220 [Limimaricola cinnabarinus]
MGLDMGFVKRRAQTEIAYLRNHSQFANSFFELDLPPSEDDSTDFQIEDWMVEAVACQWDTDDTEVARAEAALSEAEFERICWSHEYDHDTSELRAAYRRILERLHEAVTASDPVVCYWSA